MTRNLILEEIYQIREQILGEYRGDTSAYLRDAQKRLLASGRPVAKITQRTIRCTGAAKSAVSAVENPLSPPADR